MQFVLIDTEDKLVDVCSSINTGIIAIDTEFVRTKSNEPILCLVQIAFKDFKYIIDTLAIENISSLSRILSDKNVKKIFHACQQDIEVLASYDIFIENIFDTQVAEMFISHEKPASYDNLVQKYAKIKLPKLYTTSDWQRRPLSEGQLNYAINDVNYLYNIYERQVEKLKELSRENWLDEEHANILDVCISYNRENFFDTTNFTEAGVSLLNEMIVWRDKKAYKLNVSPTKIIKNDIFISIIKNGRFRLSQMRKSRLYEAKIYKEFIKFVDHSEFIKKSLYIHKKQAVPANILQFLKVAINIIAQEKNINSDLLATKEVLEDFLITKENSIVLKTWRKHVCGDMLFDVCSGKNFIKLENENLRICYE